MLCSSVTERLAIVSALLNTMNYKFFQIFSFVFYLSIFLLFLFRLCNWFYGFFGSTLIIIIIITELNYCFTCSKGS